jgi:hypothetical protein
MPFHGMLLPGVKKRSFSLPNLSDKGGDSKPIKTVVGERCFHQNIFIY